MSADPDDEALTWAGEEQDDLASPPVVARADTASGPEARSDAAATPAYLLVTYGVLAGAYAIATIGWVTVMQRSTVVQPDAFGELMFTVGELLAIASPALWFAAAFALTRGRSRVARLLALLLGLLVVVPWPFLLGV